MFSPDVRPGTDIKIVTQKGASYPQQDLHVPFGPFLADHFRFLSIFPLVCATDRRRSSLMAAPVWRTRCMYAGQASPR